MRRFALPAALVLAVAAWLAGASQRAAAIPQPANLKIATVELSVIFDKSKKVKEFTEGLEKDKKAQEDDIKKLADRIQEKQAAAAGMGTDSKERQKLEEEISGLKAKSETKMKNWNDSVKRKLDEGIQDFYGKISELVAEYAKKNSIALVLTKKAGKLEAGENMEQTMAQRSVLYGDAALDITDDIVEALDE